MKNVRLFIVSLAAAGVCAAVAIAATAKESETMKNEKTASCSTDAETPACGLPTDDAELRKILSPEQYRITKMNGTERPFQNAYWDNKKPGLYVCVISGVPLFSSSDKFDSGTGWPSFTRPVKDGVVVEKSDRSHGMVRTEVRGKKADSHLGHVFPDGPEPTGQRYCINSGALRFVPLEDLDKEGYGDYVSQVKGE